MSPCSIINSLSTAILKESMEFLVTIVYKILETISQYQNTTTSFNTTFLVQQL